jgi:hypothetical protein
MACEFAKSAFWIFFLAKAISSYPVHSWFLFIDKLIQILPLGIAST